MDTIEKIYVTKIVTTTELRHIVDALNSKTRDGYIEETTRIGLRRWFIRIELTYRDDADFVRGL